MSIKRTTSAKTKNRKSERKRYIVQLIKFETIISVSILYLTWIFICFRFIGVDSFLLECICIPLILLPFLYYLHINKRQQCVNLLLFIHQLLQQAILMFIGVYEDCFQVLIDAFRLIINYWINIYLNLRIVIQMITFMQCSCFFCCVKKYNS